jgi:DNA polymerase-4
MDMFFAPSPATLPFHAPAQDASTIPLAAGKCLKRVALDKKLRLLGVRVNALTHESAAPEKDSPAHSEFWFAEA